MKSGGGYAILTARFPHMCLTIEDASIAAEVKKRMLAAGVRVCDGLPSEWIQVVPFMPAPEADAAFEVWKREHPEVSTSLPHDYVYRHVANAGTRGKLVGYWIRVK